MARPLSFSFNSVAQEVICGSDAISGLPAVLDRLGATRAMVTCGPSILEKSDVIQRVQAALGDRFVGLFSGVSPHSPVHTLDEAMLLAADVRPDILGQRWRRQHPRHHQGHCHVVERRWENPRPPGDI